MWGTLQSHPIQTKHEFSFLSHTLPPSQSSMLKEETWSSPAILLSFPLTSKPAASLKNLSCTHSLLSSYEPTPCRPTSSTVSLTSVTSLQHLLWSFPMVPHNFPHIFMSSRFSWNPNLMSWPKSIFTVSRVHFLNLLLHGSPLAHYASTTLVFIFIYTKQFPDSGNLPTPTSLPESYSPWSFHGWLLSIFDLSLNSTFWLPHPKYASHPTHPRNSALFTIISPIPHRARPTVSTNK